MGLDGCLGVLDAGIAESDDLVLGGGLEVGEVGEDRPGLGGRETDETDTDGCHFERGR